MKLTGFVLSLAALLIAGCGDTFKGKAISEPEIAAFHARLDSSRFDEIYETAAAGFQEAGSKEKSIEFLSAVPRKLGRTKSCNIVSWKVNTFNLKTVVVLTTDTEFERGKGSETFTFEVTDGKATLLGYNINSREMMVN